MELISAVMVILASTRDVYDKITAVVGVGGIVFSSITLYLLRVQAREMSRQVDAMNTQARTMERQLAAAEKTIVLQFRPKLILRGGHYDRDSLHFQIANIGGGWAHIQEFRSTISFLDVNGEYIGLDRPPREFPKEKLDPSESFDISLSIPVEVIMEIARMLEVARNIPSAQFIPSIYWAGAIRYRDEIGIVRSVGIMRTFNPRNGRFLPEDSGSYDYSD